MALNRNKGEASTARWTSLAIAAALLAVAFALAPQTETTAYATTSGSIAVFDQVDGGMRLYNQATASSYVATDTQLVYEDIDSHSSATEEEVPWHEVREAIKTVEVVDDGISPSSMSHWFSGCVALESVEMGRLDTSEVSDFQGVFQGCPSIVVADFGGWSTAGVDESCGPAHYPSLSDSHRLSRLTASGEMRLSDAPLAEHPIRGGTDQDWELDGGDGSPFTTSELVDRINSGRGDGTWVWHTMTNRQLNRTARIEERIEDPIDEEYRTVSDGHAGQSLTHRIAATFPSSISSYEAFPITIEDALSGLEVTSLDGISIDIDGTDITGEVKGGGYGSVSYSDGRLIVAIWDALSGFGKGLPVTRESVLSVYYAAHTTGDSATGSEGNHTSVKMSYPSPPTRPTAEPSETSGAATLTASYSLVVARADRESGAGVQSVGMTVLSQTYGKFVQADGSLGDSPHMFATGPDGTATIPHVGRGTFLIHEMQSPLDYDAAGDAEVTISPAYTYDPATITGLSASAKGDDISEQDTVIDATTGAVLVRVSGQRRDAQQQATINSPADKRQVRATRTTPTTYTIEVQKVDKATRRPVEHAGYKVATNQDGATRYLRSGGALTADPAEAGIFETDDEGKFEITGLDAGSYTFHESTHPVHYSTDAPDFTITITATRDAETSELTSLSATYTGGFDDIRHKGAGYAVGQEDGILSADAESGRVSARSSALYVISMPRAGIDGDRTQAILLLLAINYLVSVGLFAARKGALDARRRASLGQ